MERAEAYNTAPDRRAATRHPVLRNTPVT